MMILLQIQENASFHNFDKDLNQVQCTLNKRPSWSWSYGSWIYNYICNWCLSIL